MTETIILTFALGFVLGGIIMYIYMRKQGVELSELLTDSLVKSKLLKEEIGKTAKPKKDWNKSKRKYYGNKKKTDSTTKA